MIKVKNSIVNGASDGVVVPQQRTKRCPEKFCSLVIKNYPELWEKFKEETFKQKEHGVLGSDEYYEIIIGLFKDKRDLCLELNKLFE